MVPGVGHLVEVVAEPSPIVALVDGRDTEHAATVPAGVPIESPSRRQAPPVLLCLSSMPVLLSDVGVETGVEGDSCWRLVRAGCRRVGVWACVQLAASDRRSLCLWRAIFVVI